MATAFRVKDWGSIFENSRTRSMGVMRWVPVPNKHDGEGFTTLLDHPDGIAHYGAWALILQLASRCEPRGTLISANGAPLTGKSIAKRLRQDSALFEAVLPRLVEIGWLEIIDVNTAIVTTYDSCQAPITEMSGDHHDRDRHLSRKKQATDYGMEEEGKEGNRREEEETPLPPKGAGGSELRQALAGIFHPGGMAEHELRPINRASERLRAKAATPDEIRRRVVHWPSHFGVPCSPAGLVEYWDALAAPGSRGGVAAVAPAQPKPQPKFRCGKCGREGYEGNFEICGYCPATPLYCPTCIGSHDCGLLKNKRTTQLAPPASAGALIPEVIETE